jgi:uncharacterized protein with von Willebrand factor type A (vWA) domain
VPITEKIALMRVVNAGIAVRAAEMRTRDSEKWIFACECGAPECAGWRELDLDEYAGVRADLDGDVLAAGHVAPSPAQRARRDAADLQESARALREQAEQQQTRARRLLRRARRLSKYPYL